MANSDNQVIVLKSKHPLKVEIRQLTPRQASLACPPGIENIVGRLSCKSDNLSSVGVWLHKESWESRSGCNAPIRDSDPRCKQIIYGFQHSDIKMQDDFMYTTDLEM